MAAPSCTAYCGERKSTRRWRTTIRQSGEVYWNLTDQQNTVRNLVEYFGSYDVEDQQHNLFNAFGQLRSQTGSADDFGDGYTGSKRRLDGAGIERHRWYDPSAGRWLSEDPIGFAGGDSNLYRYVGNSPTNATDPSGFETWLLPWERNASWNVLGTLRLWFSNTPAEHYNGLMTKDTNPSPALRQQCLASGGKAAGKLVAGTYSAGLGTNLGGYPNGWSLSHSFDLNIGITPDWMFSSSLTHSFGTGPAVGMFAGAGLNITITNAPGGVNSLLGTSSIMGCSAEGATLGSVKGSNYEGWQIGRDIVGFGAGGYYQVIITSPIWSTDPYRPGQKAFGW